MIFLSSCSEDEKSKEETSVYSTQQINNENSLFTDIRYADSELRAGIVKSCKWENGEVITVKFLNGDEFLQKKFKKYLYEWMNFANLNFVIVPSNINATIRVRFDNSGQSYSYLGTECKYITDQSKPTINFGWFNHQTEEKEFQRVIRHELGHVLGLIHEHQTPAANIIWNESVVYNWGKTTQGWDQATTYHNIIEKYTMTGTNYSAFDKSSIMTYGIPASWTSNNVSVPSNFELSATDKKYIAQWYPFGNTKRLYRTYLTNLQEHFYTTNYYELFLQNYAENIESSMGRIYTTQVSGTSPIYRYCSRIAGDHFYTTNYNELKNGNSDWKYEGVIGYAYKQAQPGTIPVYRYFLDYPSDHFYTTSYNELGSGRLGYKYEGIAFYMLP